MSLNCTFQDPITGLFQPTPCNYVVGSNNLFSNQLEYASYGYNVKLWVAAIFTAIFALSTVAHIGQAVRYKLWWCLWTFALGGALEAVGWGGRLMSAVNTAWDPTQGGQWGIDGTSFILQICLLIIAPAFLSAGLYIILGRMIMATGVQYSRFTPRSYTICFVTADFVSLVVQGAGGGMAGSASTQKDAATGAKIMVGGIFLQVFFMACYSVILAEFTYRYLTGSSLPASSRINLLRWAHFKFLTGSRLDSMSPMDPPALPTLPTQSVSISSTDQEKGLTGNYVSEDKIRLMLGACVVATVLIFTRSIFRSIELLGGWRGHIETNQVMFTVLDGLMMLVAWCLLNVVHPGFCLKSGYLKY